MKSRFLTPLVVERAGSIWRLVYPLEFESESLKQTITVPAGFLTDFASVPRLPFAYWLFGNIAQEAAVIHDALYSGIYNVTRKQADEVFSEASKAMDVSAFQRGAMWLGVRIFGASRYTEYRPETINQQALF